ncbi:acid protease [Calocera cornea HHB12733]|uniref:Acid protease n=1 Tax=Calocera cornea HHB12733 TaxID=1353952 RepID=A0A165HI38_9BASI|nr:acid protease [Calocera cornea HHB12733]
MARPVVRTGKNRRRRRLLEAGERRTRLGKRDYGDGGAEGIVLSLALSEEYPYDSVYTIDGKIGGEVFPLQVDTGSADLWVASTSCSSTACSGAQLYDPSSSTPTNKTFTIQYLQGKVSGLVVWDDVSIGSYNIPSQAFASASSVSSERLEADTFSGVLGLAPALDSRIAQLIPPVVGNDPDGAPWTSNLYGSDVPPPPFFSLMLERPEDPDTVSVLGLGMHPLQNTPPNFTAGMLDWQPVVTSNEGAVWWRVPVADISISVGGQNSSLILGKSSAVPTSARPVAVYDSGTPLILTSPSIADAFWGAYGVNPAADGNFYPPCTLMVNATVTIGAVAYPIHPLDMNIPSSNDPTSTNCIGGLQSVTGQTAGDIVLGAAFLKNVYSVYTSNSSIYMPNNSFLYPNPNQPPDDGLPHVGLYPLTNATAAALAFQTVRINNQAITPTVTPSPNSGGGQLNIPSVNTSSNLKVPLPVVIILSVVGFIALVVSLYLLRGCLYRRRREREKALAVEASDDTLTFANGKSVPGSGFDDALLFAALKKRSFRSMSDGTTGTTGTRGTGGTTVGEGSGTATDGSDIGTPMNELGEWLSLGPANGGRYPSPVRNSRVEIPMPVRRESSGDSPSEAEEKERFRSGLQRPLSNLAIPFVGPVRRHTPFVAEPQAMEDPSSGETMELPVIREREQEEEPRTAGPLLGRFSAVHNEPTSPSALEQGREPRSPTSLRRKPPPSPPKDLPPVPDDA